MIDISCFASFKLQMNSQYAHSKPHLECIRYSASFYSLNPMVKAWRPAATGNYQSHD